MQPWMLSRRATSRAAFLAVGVLCTGTAFFGGTAVFAADAAPAKPAAPVVVVGEPASITVIPEKFELNGKRARQQLLVTGQYANNELRDLTPAVEYLSTAPTLMFYQKFLTVLQRLQKTLFLQHLNLSTFLK